MNHPRAVEKFGAWRLALRRWQSEAFDAWWAEQPRDALVVATPGAGKTRFAARVAHAALSGGRVRRVFIVVPRDHLKAQTAVALAQAGIRIDHRFENAARSLAADVHGAAVTYQQVASAPGLYRRLAQTPTLVVLDEIHHAGDAATWGAALKEAFSGVEHRIGLSGTPFRSDGSAIPFVTYDAEECVASFSYDYASALRDGVCRPLVFPLQGGYAQWVSKDGSLHAASFEQSSLSKSRMSERLRTALVQETWIGDVIGKAHDRLMELRQSEHRTAGALAVAMNQDHARFIAGLVAARTGVTPTVVLSDEDGASRKIASFARGTEPWIVAVHMVSEGVDIPRLRVGVYGSNVVTETYFRQFCGRFVRAERGARQNAYVYLPDDSRLRALAARVTADVRGILRSTLSDADLQWAQRERGIPAERDNQFHAIAANVGDERVLDFGPLFNPQAHIANAAVYDDSTPEPHVEPEPAISVAEEKEILRRSLSSLVAQIATRFRVEHKNVHAALNRRLGGRISSATIDGLHKRRELALRWLDRGFDGSS